jgi:hypothetical protein
MNVMVVLILPLGRGRSITAGCEPGCWRGAVKSLIRTIADANGAGSHGAALSTISPEALEYAAIKQEQQTRLVLRDTALYVTVGGILTSATIFSAAPPKTISSLIQFATYAAPVFSLTMFLIYFRNDHYLSLARRYITKRLGPQIADHSAFALGMPALGEKSHDSFGWERFHRRPWLPWFMLRFISVFVQFLVFLAPTALTLFYAEVVLGTGLNLAAKVTAYTVMGFISVGILHLTFFD